MSETFATPWIGFRRLCPRNLQTRLLEWVAISFSRGSSRPRDRICISRIDRNHLGKPLCANVKSESESRSVDPMDWGLPGSSVHGILRQNTEVDSRSILQGIFPTQAWNPDLQHCRWILYCLGRQGSPGGVCV